MNKIFVAGRLEVTDRISRFFSEKMPEVKVSGGDWDIPENDLYEKLQDAETVLFLSETQVKTEEEGEKSVRLIKRIIKILTNETIKACVAYFVPRKSREYGVIKESNRQGEACVRAYSENMSIPAVFYHVPELFGTFYDNAIIDRIITKGTSDIPDKSYEFLCIDDLIYEIYRMVNGVPAKIGYGGYAYAQGAFHISESMIAKKLYTYKTLRKTEYPDFASAFDRALYDYYQYKCRPDNTGKIEETDGLAQIIRSKNGSLFVKRIPAGGSFAADMNGAGSIRIFLLTGSVNVNNKTYCADENIIRIDLFSDVLIVNSGKDLAVIEIWRYNTGF